MADEEIEVAKVTKVGVFSLAGTFALISLFASIIVSVIIYLVFPLFSGLLPFQLPLGLITLLILYTLGSAVLTFFSFLFLGIFYNLSSLITKGIKLYSK